MLQELNRIFSNCGVWEAGSLEESWPWYAEFSREVGGGRVAAGQATKNVDRPTHPLQGRIPEIIRTKTLFNDS